MPSLQQTDLNLTRSLNSSIAIDSDKMQIEESKKERRGERNAPPTTVRLSTLANLQYTAQLQQNAHPRNWLTLSRGKEAPPCQH